MPSLSTLKGDVAGGLTAAVLTIPISIGYGVLALQPLGDRFVPQAILAGLYSAILVPLALLALGARTTTMYGPRGVVTVLLGSIVLEHFGRTAAVAEHTLEQVLAVVFFVILAAGLFQALFGALRLGALIKYIPSPVMAGFQNAVAILIFLSQIGPMLGFTTPVPLLEIGAHLPEVQPLTLAVGLLTSLVVWRLPNFTRRIPAPAAGLVVGTVAYHVLSFLGFGAALGPVIGAMPSALPTPAYLGEVVTLLADAAIWPALPALLGGALSLAIVASLDALLCAKMVEGVSGRRSNSSRDLLRLGLGNSIAACFGAVPAGVNLGPSFANLRAGGATGVSLAVSATTALLVVLLLGPVLALVPRVALAGTLLVIAVQLVDQWTVQLVQRIVSRDFMHWKIPAFDLLVVCLVAAVTIALDLILAVAIGVAVAIASFLLRMSKSVIRRGYRGDAVRSKRTRDAELTDFLAVEGRRILVLELEGPLFFGTAEDLANRVEASLRQDVSYLILDLKRVNDVDSTGARIVLQIHDRLRRDGRHVFISHLEDNPSLAATFAATGALAGLGRGALFADTDAALEHAEGHLILSHRPDARAAGELPVDRLPVLSGLSDAERALVGTLLVRRTYQAGEIVVKEGDDDHSLLMIARGTASVKIGLSGDRHKRLATFSPGTVFGEVALLDKEPRSATVTADEDLVCYVLPEAAFDTLTSRHPRIAIHLLTNLGRDLSRRLRKATAMISQLEG